MPKQLVRTRAADRDLFRHVATIQAELDYTEQTSWLLFLKYVDGLGQDLADEAALDGRKCKRWGTVAA